MKFYENIFFKEKSSNIGADKRAQILYFEVMMSFEVV